MDAGPESNAGRQVVTVHLTLLDLFRFNLAILPRSSWGRLSLGAYLGFGIVTGFAIVGVPATFREVLAWLLAAAAVTMVGLIVFCVFLVPFFFLSSRTPGLLGEHVFTIKHEGLREETSANDTLIRWGGAHDLHRTDGFILIGTSPVMFHVLPRRSFASQAAFEAFWAAIQPLKRQ